MLTSFKCYKFGRERHIYNAIFVLLAMRSLSRLNKSLLI